MTAGIPHRRPPSESPATPIAATPGRHFSARSYKRPVTGLVTVLVIAAVVALAVVQFRGGFTSTVPVTVLSERAGLLMTKGAKVTLHGAQVGTVSSIEALPDGGAALHLAMDPSRLSLIPENVRVDIAPPTVFGAKAVDLVDPANPSTTTLAPGQVLNAENVTVETNSLFEKLSAVLGEVDPAKLNETLGAFATAFSGRGAKLGQTVSDFNAFLAKVEPSLPNLSHDLQVAPDVINAYADAAPDLLTIARNTTTLSQTFVDEQQNLDMLLLNAIGLADAGTDVLGGNAQALTDVLHLLVPTTDLTNRYSPALTCGLKGMIPMAGQPPEQVPGLVVLGAISLGAERYRYPQNLPKVAAAGGPQCAGQQPVAFNTFPPFLVADVGANPFERGNEGILLNSDGIKQLLYGPTDGPPRNTAQIGQPG